MLLPVGNASTAARGTVRTCRCQCKCYYCCRGRCVGLLLPVIMLSAVLPQGVLYKPAITQWLMQAGATQICCCQCTCWVLPQGALHKPAANSDHAWCCHRGCCKILLPPMVMLGAATTQKYSVHGLTLPTNDSPIPIHTPSRWQRPRNGAAGQSQVAPCHFPLTHHGHFAPWLQNQGRYRGLDSALLSSSFIFSSPRGCKERIYIPV